MEPVSYPTLNEVLAKSTRHVSLGQGATVRLLERLQTLTQLQLLEKDTCLKNQSLCYDTSLGCSLMRILLCLTPPVVVEVRCERLSLLAQSMCSASKLIPSLPDSPAKPSRDPVS